MDNFPKKIIKNVENLTLQTIFKLYNIFNHLNLSLNMRTVKKIMRENVGQRVQTVCYKMSKFWGSKVQHGGNK